MPPLSSSAVRFGFEPLEARNMLTDVLPTFALTDVNPTSATNGQTITPRDYLGEVSAWYFGHAT